MAITVKYDSILDELRESDSGAVALPIEQAGSVVVSSPTAINFNSGATVTSVGGTAQVDISAGSLAVQDIRKDRASATTLYTGIAAAGTAVSAAGWALLKLVLTGNDYESRQVYTASDTWNNRASATYTLSNTYSTS